MKSMFMFFVVSLMLSVGCSKMSSVSLSDQEQMQLLVSTLVAKAPTKPMTNVDQCAITLAKYEDVSKEGDVVSATVSYQPSQLKMLAMLSKTFFKTKESDGCSAFKQDMAKHEGDSAPYATYKVSVNFKTGERVSLTSPSRETSSTK